MSSLEVKLPCESHALFDYMADQWSPQKTAKREIEDDFYNSVNVNLLVRDLQAACTLENLNGVRLLISALGRKEYTYHGTRPASSNVNFKTWFLRRLEVYDLHDIHENMLLKGKYNRF